MRCVIVNLPHPHPEKDGRSIQLEAEPWCAVDRADYDPREDVAPVDGDRCDHCDVCLDCDAHEPCVEPTGKEHRSHEWVVSAMDEPERALELLSDEVLRLRAALMREKSKRRAKERA